MRVKKLRLPKLAQVSEISELNCYNRYFWQKKYAHPYTCRGRVQQKINISTDWQPVRIYWALMIRVEYICQNKSSKPIEHRHRRRALVKAFWQQGWSSSPGRAHSILAPVKWWEARFKNKRRSVSGT
jgi:hypothetical protein